MPQLPSTFPHIPLDIIGAIIVLGVVFGFFLYARKTTGVALLLAPYFSGMLFSFFPYYDVLNRYGGEGRAREFLHLGVFGVFFFVAFFTIRRAVASVYPANAIVKSIEAALIAFVSVGSTLIILSKVVAVRAVSGLIPSLQVVLFASSAPFWWGVGTLFLLIFLSRNS